MSKALPLLREALSAGLVSSLPNLGDDDYQARFALLEAMLSNLLHHLLCTGIGL